MNDKKIVYGDNSFYPMRIYESKESLKQEILDSLYENGEFEDKFEEWLNYNYTCTTLLDMDKQTAESKFLESYISDYMYENVQECEMW
jgi:hypothetical protein